MAQPTKPHRTADLCLLLCPGRSIFKLDFSHYEAIRRKTGCYILTVNHAIHWFYEPDGWLGNTTSPYKEDTTWARIIAKPKVKEGDRELWYFKRQGMDRFLINHFYPGFLMITKRTVVNTGLRAIEVARDEIQAKEIILCGLNMSSFNFCHSMLRLQDCIKNQEFPKNQKNVPENSIHWKVYNSRQAVNPKEVRRPGLKIKKIGGQFPCEYIKPRQLLERYDINPVHPLEEFR